MPVVDPHRVQAVFLLAVDAPDQASREALLERECAANSELRRRVEVLLGAHDMPGSFLEQPVVNPAAPGDLSFPEHFRDAAGRPAPAEGYERPTLSAGAIVADRYRLLELIGEGGMGAVWMTEQREPVKRLVALKLIKPGMDSRQVLSRFAAERQALALMDHPNIAKVFDGGVTDQGCPFFVMEYVKGVPITDYCDHARLTLRQRLELFTPICHAVQHAHQKGIIHRDSKPSNILVCLYDGKPVPKVIDFGLAKAMHQSLTEQPLFTSHGLMVGTPLYMSPEQAEFNNLDVDTRTDVYSLGVVLYELLTGSTPLEKQQLKEAAWHEMLRLIKEEAPPKPSTKLSGSGSLPSIAAQRGVEPAQLSRAVRGDLDWIVMKSLEKERSRRYDTATSLARDIDHYLHDEPVEACPPSASYRLKKLLRRNKGLVAAAAAVFLAMVAGVTGTTLGLIEARRQEGVAVAAAGKERQAREAESRRAEAEITQRKRAEAAESLANDRLKQVTNEKNRADQAAAIAAAVNEFISDDILGQADSLAQADSGHAPTHDLTVRTAIDRAAEKVGRAFADRPLVEAQVRRTVGDVYLGLGEPEKAAEHLERAAKLLRKHLDADDPWTQSTQASLITAYNQLGRVDDAISLSEQVYEDSLRRWGAEHSETLLIMNNLAMAYHAAGKMDQAIELLEQAREVSLKSHVANHPATLTYSANLAAAMCDAGRIAEAIPLFEQVRGTFVKSFGAEHPQTLKSTLSLAIRYQRLDRAAECIELLESARQPMLTQLGADHPQYLLLLETLAGAYLDQGVTDMAIPGRVRLKEIAELLVQLYTTRGETYKSDQWRQTLLELHGPDSELATPPTAE